MIEERAESRRESVERAGREPLSSADLVRRPESIPVNAPAVEGAPEQLERAPLFRENDLGDARRRWQDVQGSFVDDPRTAVCNADELVASLMTKLAQMFADERTKLEKEWDQEENVSTESLRLALRRYRSFFDRLLSV